MAVKKKGEIRLTATVDMGEFADKLANGSVKKKHGYLTIFKDELVLTGLKEVVTTSLQAVKITKGKLAGRTIYRAIDDTAATGRHFQLLYLKTKASGKGLKRKAAIYDAVQAYFPGWMPTYEILQWIEKKLGKKPSIVITDLGTRVSVFTNKQLR
jgi:hypothetical protein